MQAYQTALIIRNILSIYIVVCTAYILVQVYPSGEHRLAGWGEAVKT